MTEYLVRKQMLLSCLHSHQNLVSQRPAFDGHIGGTIGDKTGWSELVSHMSACQQLFHCAKEWWKFNGRYLHSTNFFLRCDVISPKRGKWIGGACGRV